MTTFFVAVTSDLTKPLEFRSMKGRELSIPIILSNQKEVRLFIVDAALDNQPLQLNVVDENGQTLAQAYMLDKTTQIFTSLGLLANVTMLRTDSPSCQEIVK